MLTKEINRCILPRSLSKTLFDNQIGESDARPKNCCKQQHQGNTQTLEEIMSRSVKIIISVAYFLMVTLGLFNLFVLSPAKNIEEIKTKPSMEIKHRTSYGPIDIYFFYDANEVLMVNNQEPGMKEAIPPGTYISTLYYYIHPYTHKLTLAAVNRDGHLICAGEEGVGWYLFDRRSDAGRKLLVRYSIPRVIATPDE